MLSSGRLPGRSENGRIPGRDGGLYRNAEAWTTPASTPRAQTGQAGQEAQMAGPDQAVAVSLSIAATSSLTAAMLLSSAARSSGSSFNSITFSTPPLPSTTGTPTK